jgi:hypothetical protein
LRRYLAVHGHGFAADITLGTIIGSRAVGATEELHGFTRLDTLATQLLGGLAILPISTRQAQTRPLRHAGKDNIRFRSRELFALKPVGTLLDAGLRTDVLAQMFDTPAGQAIAVFCARIKKAAVARLALGTSGVSIELCVVTFVGHDEVQSKILIITGIDAEIRQVSGIIRLLQPIRLVLAVGGLKVLY